MEETMKRKLALILVLLLIVTSLTACGGTQSNGSNQPNKTDGMDVMYYAYNSIPILTWDPSIEFSNGIVILNNIYEQLLRFNAATKEYEKVLATDYKKSEDGLVWIEKGLNSKMELPLMRKLLNIRWKEQKKSVKERLLFGIL